MTNVLGRLTVQQLEAYATHQLGAPPEGPIEMRQLVDEAGQHLVAIHQWRWTQGRMLRLRTRPQVALTGGTWTEATKTLTKVGAFAAYSFLSGDTLEVGAGTGATTGSVDVASRVDDDSVTLVASIGAAADGQTDIEAVMPNDQIEVPTDFDLQAITAYQLSDALIGTFELTSPQGLANLRTWPGLTSTISFWGLVNYVRAVGAVPALRIDLWPETTSSEEKLTIFYRSGWRTPASDNEVLSIPPWCNTLMRQVFMAMVYAHEEPERGSLEQRLQMIEEGLVFRTARKRDIESQPDVGPMLSGWMSDDGRPDWSERFSLYRSPSA